MAASNSNERTIVTARPCVAGSSIMAVAWPDALTAQDALLQLHSHEDRGRGRITQHCCHSLAHRQAGALILTACYPAPEHVQAF